MPDAVDEIHNMSLI